MSAPGFYRRCVSPAILDWSMRSARLAGRRREVLAAAHGSVLEIGVGTGLNLRFYPAGVVRICGIDPSAAILARAAGRASDAPCPAVLVQGSAEALPFPGGAFDTVVSTWTLCSIPHPEVALTEMRRVLRPGGELLFVEHGAAPDDRVRRWQERVTPCWRRVSGGCHLNRDIAGLIGAAGFCILELRTGYLGMPKIATFLYQGQAVPE